jgi:uncharacterized membrane protein
MPRGRIARERLARLEAGTLHAGGALEHEGAKLVRGFCQDPFWQAQAALLGALILYFALPGKLVVGPRWLMPALELALIGGLYLDRPRRGREASRRERGVVLILLAMVAAANLVSLALLVHYLLRGGKAGGHQLLLSSLVIWLTNVAVFALWFWQLDRGGPDRRAQGDDGPPDFLFPQMAEPQLAQTWRPAFLDYLYTAFTNATAFSPTDAMPVSPLAKLLMMAQSAVSLVTVLLVAARAVNILS